MIDGPQSPFQPAITSGTIAVATWTSIQEWTAGDVVVVVFIFGTDSVEVIALENSPYLLLAKANSSKVSQSRLNYDRKVLVFSHKNR